MSRYNARCHKSLSKKIVYKVLLSTEIKSLVKLAAPVSLAQLSLVGMSATDVLIAGQAGTNDLAGLSVGANAWNMVILFFMGIGFATQPLIAKRFGAGDEVGLKHQLQQSIWLCFALGIIAMLAVWIMAWLLSFVDYEPELLRVGIGYLLAISLCAIPMTLIPAVRGTLEGMSLTREVFLVNFAAFLLNIPLDYILVNGLYGMPQLGGVGCAWATVILMWLAFFVNVLILKWHPKLKSRALLAEFQKPYKPTIISTVRMGVPIGLSIAIELGMFAGAGLMIAKFGAVASGAHSVAIIVASLSFMLYTGLGQGVTIRASQFLGANKPDAAWYTIKVGTVFNLVVACVFCACFVLFNEPLVRLFSDDPQVIELAVILLYFGAAFQIVDCLQVAVICALRAYHETASPPKYQLIAFWGIGLPLGIGLSFYNWIPTINGPQGMWVAMLVSLTLVSVLLLHRLTQYKCEYEHADV